VPVEELHDSAVLYVTGNQNLNLVPEDKAKLKTFIEEGGIVVGNADCANAEFAAGFRRLGTQLFPEYEFRAVPKDSVIYTGEQYRASKWKEPPRVLELNNGVRDLMLLIPDADPSKYFELHQVGGRQYLYELMSDILFYAVDQSGTRMKGETYIVRPNPSAAIKRTVKVARVQYDGNWDPEPGGWIRLAAVMRNTRGIDLQVSPVRLGQGKLDRSFKLAHLTGTAAFHLTGAAEDELRKFVAQGGKLVVDAAGGGATFDAAAQSELKTLFPKGSLDTLAGNNPIFTFGQILDRAVYRRYARSRIEKTAAFRLQAMDVDGRTSVFYSAEDISEGLVGEPIDGIYGYDPKVATGLMGNLIAYSAAR
jgi:hypothetical protein